MNPRAWEIVGDTCLVSNAKLSAADFQAICTQLRTEPLRVQRLGYVAARQAAQLEPVEMVWNGESSTAIAHPGDWVVSNLSQCRPLRDSEGRTNTYVVRQDRFVALYETTTDACELGIICRPRAFVYALYFSGGLDIVAPWGERQTTASGYLVLNGDDVYANSRVVFCATYEASPSPP
jgi:hypothetical protein